jgi:2-polyprenyl-6-methoxyphenol hydroxylase-like FAD-dependent oxidoreductase
MRANLMVYRDMRDPWLKTMRTAPVDAMLEVMPGLRDLLGEFAVPGFVKIRPADLYRTRGVRQPGVVLVGDAFATSCPAAGTGTSKVFTDVERLCNVHIPNWLAGRGMGADRIAAFYDDPVKRACDEQSLDKAYWLRALSTESGLTWKAQRWARFAVSRIREARHRAAAGSPGALNPT